MVLLHCSRLLSDALWDRPRKRCSRSSAWGRRGVLDEGLDWRDEDPQIWPKENGIHLLPDDQAEKRNIFKEEHTCSPAAANNMPADCPVFRFIEPTNKLSPRRGRFQLEQVPPRKPHQQTSQRRGRELTYCIHSYMWGGTPYYSLPKGSCVVPLWGSYTRIPDTSFKKELHWSVRCAQPKS